MHYLIREDSYRVLMGVGLEAEEDPGKKPDKKASGLLMHLEEINICYVYLRV